MQAIYKYLCTVLFTSCGYVAFAQNITAPYSVYGIGDIEQRTYNNMGGMGFTGLGMRSSYYTVGTNPASVAHLPLSLLLLQGAGSGRTVSYSGNAINSSNSNAKDFSLKGLSLSTKVNKVWGSSLGFKQASYVGYRFSAAKTIEGTTDAYALQYSGDGGLYDFYWNNGFALGKRLSAGVTGSFIAGPIHQTESLVDESGNAFDVKRRDYFGNFRLNTGILYNTKLGKQKTLTIGATYAPKSAMNYERTYSLTQNSTAVFTDTAFSFHNFSMPQSYGVGLSLAGKKGTTWAADYAFEDWGALGIKGTGWKLVSSQRIGAGVEFASENNERQSAVHRKAFQFGGFYQSSYQQINGRPIAGYGVTAGISRALKNGFMYALSAEGGTRGTTANGLIRENYLQLSLHLSYRDIILSKGRRFD